MSSNIPPSGPPTPPPPPPQQGEVLEQGGGTPVAAGSSGGGGLRKGLLIGGGVVGAAAIGVGAWAAYSFLATGPQPAEALPADTLAYISVDLDPSGGQKIEALRTLNKFPAFEKEVGVDTDDDIKKSLFEKVLEDAPCDDLDYADDIEPWLGDRAAVAAVDSGGETPDAVVVVQVKDADKADEGLDKIRACGTDESDVGSDAEESGGWVIEGDWAVIAETEDIAKEVAEEAGKGSLADDEDFQKWTGEAGDAGIVTMYAGPEVGDYLADNADLLGFPFGMTSASAECVVVVPEGEDAASFDETCEGDVVEGGDSASGDTQLPEELENRLRDFRGVAGTIRFDDGAIELEFAGDGEAAMPFLGDTRADEVIASLPDDTAAAIGVGFSEGWFSDVLEFYAPLVGQGDDLDSLIDELSQQTGLDLPDDIETLFGEAAALSVSSDLDPDALANTSDFSDVPVALKVKGDAEEIEAVLDKLRGQLPPEESLFLESDSEGDMVVIGPSPDYRSEVLEDGNLGDNEVFQDVVRESEEANAVLFVNIDELQDAFEEMSGEDQEFMDNVTPLSGFGISAWVDGDTAHSVVRITTN